ncbi:two-partner secretion domain-containing protein [Candidatus Marithrix sp. Canyon 246]|uniref:two-partner secretion domain-containing protein n=1 Tax=Candidatus Marithrix sp. Canyon 246 TaxID=1827136 RepID=UPI00084A0D8A|nr:filamentous hemagglutinin N-terminal domain-containing protein [Candidatus Marithrix sp. Canyon 246]
MIIFIALLLYSSVIYAAPIKIDGINFQVTPSMGKQFGGNVFYSFDGFNLNKEQVVVFSGSNDIENIIGRITGGKESVIDGEIRSEIANANLYLMNPYGFSFGPNAVLDVQGSIHLTTASKIYLGNTGVFEANPEKASVLVSAAPSDFGFLDAAAIEFEGSELFVRAGNTLSISAGDIKLNEANLTANSGRINLTALNSIELNHSNINAGKTKTGEIYIRAGKFILKNSNILANTIEQDIALIDIQADDFIMNNSKIESDTFGPGNAGTIIINVAQKAILDQQSQISSTSLNKGIGGDAGNIFINANELELINSTISTNAEAAQGGNIILNVRECFKMNVSELSATVKGGIGKGGNLAIGNPSLFNIEDSKIFANASGGDGGFILIISESAISRSNQIAASSETGRAGDIKIDDIYNVGISSLPIEFVDDDNLLIAQDCSIVNDTESSSFVVTGRGGLLNAPDDLQTYIPTINY